jgi:hypothetical protein
LPSVGNGAEAWGQSGHFLTVNRKIGKWENQIKLKNMDSNFISIRPAVFLVFLVIMRMIGIGREGIKVSGKREHIPIDVNNVHKNIDPPQAFTSHKGSKVYLI